MKKIVFVLFLLGIFFLLFGFYQMATASGDDVGESQAAMLTATQQSDGIEQKPQPTPTIDSQSTLQAAISLSLNAQETASAAIKIANDANVELEKQKNIGLSIEATENASQRAHVEKMKTIENDTIALNNENLKITNENIALDNENKRLTNENLRLQNDADQIKIEASRTLGVYVMLALIAVGLIGLGFFVVKNIFEKRPHPQTKQMDDEIKSTNRNQAASSRQAIHHPSSFSETESLADGFDKLLPPIVNVVDERDGSISVMLDDWTGIATLEQLLCVANGVLIEGKSLAIGNWYGTDEDGNPRPFTRSEFERFIKAISRDGIGVDHRILAYLFNGHAVLKPIGKTYFAQLREQYGQ